jgi:hypothetical protein
VKGRILRRITLASLYSDLVFQVSEGHKIEIPATMDVTPEQLAILEAHAAKHHDSRHHIATVEKVRNSI